jgi:hypothetical protein
MNKDFYEFWGNFLLNLARGHQQMENLSALMKQGVAEMNDLAKGFSDTYGRYAPAGAGDDSAAVAWQKAMADFQRSLSPFAALWGWVPQAEHERVVRDRDELQKKVKDQEDVIKQLRDLLNQEGRGHLMLVDHWKRSLKEQNDQFQALMKSIRNSIDEDR